MKFSIVFAVLLVVFVTYSEAQTCAGRPANPDCAGGLHSGRWGPNCTQRSMWSYDARSRQCVQFRYLGCAGNNNRWCTRQSCEQRCRR